MDGEVGSYADAPMSLAEARAFRSGCARQWAPRDALVWLLREIDAGRVPAPISLTVCYVQPGDEPGTLATRFVTAGRDTVTALGSLARVAHLMNASDA